MRRILLFALCLLLGFAAGLTLRKASDPTGTDARSGPASQPVAASAPRRNLAAPGTAQPRPAAAPPHFDPPTDIAGFHARMDEVLAAAHAGNEQAALTLWEYLSQCDGETGDSLRSQRRTHRDAMQSLEQDAADSRPELLDSRRDQAERHLARAEARHALCKDLGDLRGTALGWLELAMTRGSTAAVRTVMGSLGHRMDTASRTRYAERLVRLRDAALQHLIHGGLSRGPDAPRLMMLGHISGLLPYDEARRAGYAYAWWLARQVDPGQGLWIGPSPLEEQRLSPGDRAEAERIGDAAFQACCG